MHVKVLSSAPGAGQIEDFLGFSDVSTFGQDQEVLLPLRTPNLNLHSTPLRERLSISCSVLITNSQ
jgi:hypothetical protein